MNTLQYYSTAWAPAVTGLQHRKCLLFVNNTQTHWASGTTIIGVHHCVVLWSYCVYPNCQQWTHCNVSPPAVTFFGITLVYFLSIIHTETSMYTLRHRCTNLELESFTHTTTIVTYWSIASVYYLWIAYKQNETTVCSNVVLVTCITSIASVCFLWIVNKHRSNPLQQS